MRDVLGWRRKFGVLGPSTNTSTDSTSRGGVAIASRSDPGPVSLSVVTTRVAGTDRPSSGSRRRGRRE